MFTRYEVTWTTSPSPAPAAARMLATFPDVERDRAQLVGRGAGERVVLSA
jgi:hypothetical protein